MEDRIFNCVVIAFRTNTDSNTYSVNIELTVTPYICRGRSAEEVKAVHTKIASKLFTSKAGYDNFLVEVREIYKEEVQQLLNGKIAILPPLDDSIFDAETLE